MKGEEHEELGGNIFPRGLDQQAWICSWNGGGILMIGRLVVSFLVAFVVTPMLLAAPIAAMSESNETIPQEVLEAAVKRAAQQVQLPMTGPNAVTFRYGEPDGGPGVIITQTPIIGQRGKLALTGTQPATPTAPANTVGIAVFPDEIYRRWPGAREDRRYLENMLYLVLCHEMEHMPECPVVPGGVPPHPTDSPPGPSTPDNLCHSVRQYVRDAQRACNKAAEAQSDPDLCDACRCKVMHQYCSAYRDAKERAGNPVYAGVGPNCVPAIPLTNGQAIPDCPTCPDTLGDCPVPSHHYTH